jgi:5-(carboxyamino)imidazole ribonucleotide mutase
MSREKIVILMGSRRDREFASRIVQFLEKEKFPVRCEYNVASAHKTLERLSGILKRYEKKDDRVVFITIAGLSDALSGVVAGFTRYPVIACPPDSEKQGWPKVFSTVVTPEGVAVAYVPRPENAALAAVKILALSDPKLVEKFVSYQQKLRENVHGKATD